MPRSAGFEVDVKDFQQAMAFYAAATGKDKASVANRGAKNLAFRAAQFTKKANASEIRSLKSKAWWWQYVSKVIRDSGVKWTAGRKKKRTVEIKGRYTKAQLAAASRRLLTARTRSAGFMRLGFIRAGKKFGGKGAEKAKLTRVKAVGRMAKPNQEAAFWGASWEGKKGSRNARDVTKKQKIVDRAIKKSLRFVTEDMVKFANKKMAERARQISAR